MVYLIGKLDKKPIILAFGYTKQVNLNMFNSIGGFFIDRKMVYLIGRIKINK
jgi:hypothetical protein